MRSATAVVDAKMSLRPMPCLCSTTAWVRVERLTHGATSVKLLQWTLQEFFAVDAARIGSRHHAHESQLWALPMFKHGVFKIIVTALLINLKTGRALLTNWATSPGSEQ